MKNDLVMPGDKDGEKKKWKFCDVKRGLPAALGLGRGMPGAPTPQDKAHNGPGQPGHCGCLLGRAWGLQCPGGRSVLEGKQTQQSGPRQAHSPVLRAAPS